MSNPISRLLRYTPFRILLPSLLMFMLFAGSVFVYLLPSIHAAFMSYKEESISELTGSVISTFAYLHKLEQQGELTGDEARAIAYQITRDLRYGKENKDYFWINDLTPRMIMHPYRTELEGQDLTDYRDKNGKALFVEFVQVAKERGSGFVDYYWQWKDRPELVVKKRSFVREFEPWGWVVGTGIYLDDVEQEIAAYRNLLTGIFLTILLVIAGLKLYILRQTALAEEEREVLLGALQESEERYRTIADFTYDWEVWLGTDQQLLYCSPSCERITGFSPDYFFGEDDHVRSIVISGDYEVWDRYLETVQDQGSGVADFRIHSHDKRMRWLNVVGRSVSGVDGRELGIRCSFRDVTERKEMEDRLRYQALHDPLTGLANRTLCQDRIAQAMNRASRRENYYFAVIFLDLDRFKVINDALGHHFGDRVLSETANRLKEIVRNLDTVSRFGGDEFVLLLDELSSPGEAIRIVKRLRHELGKPFVFNGNEVHTTASFGVVLSPIEEYGAAEILQHANVAMHRAKEKGRNRFMVFTSRMLENTMDQLSLENDMRRSMERHEFHVEYQPVMDLADSSIVGFEALLRWNHPQRGVIMPDEFIPVAEETGVILPLGEWVLRTALKDLAGWRTTIPGCENMFMSVNVSASQFSRIGLDAVVVGTLNEFGLAPEALKLEITEATILDQSESVVRLLGRLRDRGVRFSIDDFGTGYSSLSQLQQLPIDTLKVDRSFVSRMQSEPEDLEIVKAVVGLANSLDLNVVAEGVEEQSQLDILVDLNCKWVQGFYFHKPLSTSQVGKLLGKREM